MKAQKIRPARTCLRRSKKRIDTLTRQRYRRDARIARGLKPQLAARENPQPKEGRSRKALQTSEASEAKAEHIAKPETEPDPAGRHARSGDRCRRGAELFFPTSGGIPVQSAPDFDQAIAAVPAVLMKPDIIIMVSDSGHRRGAWWLTRLGDKSPRMCAVHHCQGASGLEIGKLAARLTAKPEPGNASAQRRNPSKPIKAAGSTQKQS